MRVRNVCLLAVLFVATLAQAQQNGAEREPNRWMLGFEAGTEGIEGTFRSDKWSIRQGFVGQLHGDFITTLAQNFYFGVKPEFIFADGRLSVTAGLRYLSMSCTLDNNSRFGFFFLRYSEDGTTTRYARVRSMFEHHHFIGVPLEARWRPFRFPNPQFNLHLTVGADAYLKLASDIEIDFVNEFMQDSQQTILNYVGAETNNFLSRAFFGFGASYSFRNRKALTMDILFPFFLTENNFTLITPQNNVAFQLSFQIPLSR